MSAYDDAEESAEDSEPVEFFSISINDGAMVWRHCTGSRDIVDDSGAIYTAIAAERGEVAITLPGAVKDCILTLPIDHPYCTRYTKKSTPPMKTTVVIYRRLDGETRQIWSGEINEMSCEGRLASFRIPSRAGAWLLRVIPNHAIARICPLGLFSTTCGVSRTGTGPSGLPHQQTVIITAIDGNVITVDLSNITASDSLREGWAENGECLYGAMNERVTVVVQKDLNPGVGTITQLTLHEPLVDARAGEVVVISAGCDKTLQTCHAKFSNRQNHASYPGLPASNPFIPAGTGTEPLQ